MNARARYSFKPIIHPEIYNALVTHRNLFWPPSTIDFQADKKGISFLSQEEKKFIKHVLAFFAQSDGIVSENLATRFKMDIENLEKGFKMALSDGRAIDPREKGIVQKRCDLSEIKFFYTFQEMMENIHAETYAELIEIYAEDEAEKNFLFDAISNLPTVAKKGKWAEKWLFSNEDFAKRLIAFAIIEGIYFSGSFCAIFWIREYKQHKEVGKGPLLPALCQSNEYISRDEGLHCDFAALVYHYLGLEVSEHDFHQMLKEAIEIEKEFVRDALPVNLLGMNAEKMCQYIEHVCDIFCDKFGFKRIFNTSNPFDWMKKISMSGKKDFFLEQVTEYSLEDNTDVIGTMIGELDLSNEDF